MALLGEDPGLAPLKLLLVKRGNPFFLEETVQTLVETKALVGERGAYRLTQPIEAIQIPPTVQVMLAARIDRLPPDDKRLLQVASVIGKDVPFVLLRRSRTFRTRRSAADSTIYRRPNSSTRRSSFPTSNTRSSTRSRTR